MLKDLVLEYQDIDQPIKRADFTSSYGTSCRLTKGKIVSMEFRYQGADQSTVVSFATKEEVQQFIAILTNMKDQM